MRRLCASLSRALNRLSGGTPGQTLCARMARIHGHDCLFCRVIAAVLREPDHCWRERINELRRARKAAD